MKKPWAIVSGGRFSPLADIEKCGYIIACDRGYEYLHEAGLRPDLLVGDFDSYTGPLPRDVPRLDLPVEKDDTDTMAAIRHALLSAAGKYGFTALWEGGLTICWETCRRQPFAVKHGVWVRIIDRRRRYGSLPVGASPCRSGKAGPFRCWPCRTGAPG